MASPSASSYGSGTPPPQSTPLSPKYLFGGDRRWDSSQWTDSDDRVRGGRSQSHLTVSRVGAATRAEFSGHLDTSALGGAGFASQRTVNDLCCWDLSGYESLTLDVADADEKRYTLILKDTILPRRDDGREQSTVSWEYDFTVGTVGGNAGSTTVVMPLADFQPTYRGRPKPDAAPLDLSKVKRITFMMRSFFGDQEGDFSLSINSLAAGGAAPAGATEIRASRHSLSDGTVEVAEEDYVRVDNVEMKHETDHANDNTSWLAWLRGSWSR